MPDRVEPEGSLHAPIILIGEAPGKTEMELGRPFVGPTYRDKLLPWWNDCVPRLERSMFRILNVLDYQPHPRIDAVPEHEMRAAIETNVHEQLAMHEGPDGGGPVVIVPVGNYALYALTGNGRVSWHTKDGRHERPGIKDWRGSILAYTDRRGRTCKVIPSVHPASTFYKDASLEWVLRMDWQRIATDVQFRELRLPEYVKAIGPTVNEVVEFVRWTRSEAAKVKDGVKYHERLACSLDVETPYKTEYTTTTKALTTGRCMTCGHTRLRHESTKPFKQPKNKPSVEPPCDAYNPPMGKPRRKIVSEDSYLGCVGYCWRPDYTLCVPTTLEYWQDPSALAVVLQTLANFHADANIDFGGQNFGFDAWWCAEERMPIRNMAWDLMKMHRVQRPWSDWNSLDFQASLDTRVPFWKHEAKMPNEISRWSHNREQLWAYNCTDNHAQRVLLDARSKGLADGGRLEFYEQNEGTIDAPLLTLSRTGIRIDDEGRAVEHDRVVSEAVEVAKEITVDAGMAVVAKVAVSTQKMKVFLYEKLRLPLQYKKRKKGNVVTKTVSTDVTVIKRLMEQFPGLAALQAVGTKVLLHRRLMTVRGFLAAKKIHADGRWYAIFKQDTKLGRLSSEETPKDTGANLQNIDRRLRRFFIADRDDEA